MDIAENIAEQKTEIPVRFEIGSQEVNLEKVNRLARRMLLSQASKYRKKYSNLKDFRDEQGRGVTIVLRQPDPGKRSVECIVEYPEALQGEIKGSEKAERVA